MRRVLTWQAACDVRAKRKEGKTMKVIAKETGISLATVSRICNNTVWNTEEYGQLKYFCLYCGEKDKQKMVSSKTCKKCRAKRNNAARRKALTIKRTEMLAELGDECRICEKKLTAEQKNWVRHHVSYEPERTVVLCKGCHLWLHGQGQVHNHLLKHEYEKDLAPYVFALAVVALYEKELA
jgi:hypothetical protein